MKFLVISDLHGNYKVFDKMQEQFKSADAVLFAGDFTQFGHEETALPALEALCKMHDTIFAVIGNCDECDFLDEVEKRDISVENTLVSHEGLVFAGSGGGSKFDGSTPNEREDEELRADFNIISEQSDSEDSGNSEWNNLIAIMHNPPKDTECDKITCGAHVGSPLLREFIEKYKPLAVVTGHIHESVGIDKIGDTTIINPGTLLENRYAWLEVEKKDDKWTVTKATLETVE